MLGRMENKGTIIKKIKNILLKSTDIRACFLFGSFVSENFNDSSDIDIAVLSGQKIEGKKLLSIRQEVERVISRDVDLVQVDKDLSFVLKNEIATKGVLLFSHDQKLSNRFLEKTPQMYLDFMKFREPLEDAYIQKKRKQ